MVMVEEERRRSDELVGRATGDDDEIKLDPPVWPATTTTCILFERDR